MPSIPIIDTHLHLWDPSQLQYPWLADIPLLNKPFLQVDFQQETEKIHIDKLVFVQCECEFSECEKEVSWVSGIARLEKRIQGIVAWAPLEQGKSVAAVLDRYASNPLVKGIRRIIQFESDPKFCLRNDFVDGVRLLSEYDFSFDICVSHQQLGKVIELVKLCPEVGFVLDHLGKPDIKNQVFEPWHSNIKELAKNKNVHCKLSGLVTEANLNTWNLDDLQPYVECVIRYFTPDRIMYGGDWPVILQGAGYLQWVQVVDELLAGFSQEDQHKIYYSNGNAFYGLAHDKKLT